MTSGCRSVPMMRLPGARAAVAAAPPRGAAPLWLAVALLAAPGAGAVPALAQIPDTAEAPVDSVIITPEVPVTQLPAADTGKAAGRPSPGGAFLRSMVIPGWGQAAYDAHFRGGIYFAGWAGNWFMLFRTYTRLGEARSRYDRRADQLVDSLLTNTENPDSVRALLERPDYFEGVVRTDGIGNDLRKLVRAREQQREDWVAWSIFWLLASGVDALVTAHLADFPAAVDMQPERDGSVSFRAAIPVGGGARRATVPAVAAPGPARSPMDSLDGRRP